MAVNLATKYSSQIAEVFTAGSFVKGKTSTTFDLTGVKTRRMALKAEDQSRRHRA